MDFDKAAIAGLEIFGHKPGDWAQIIETGAPSAFVDHLEDLLDPDALGQRSPDPGTLDDLDPLNLRIVMPLTGLAAYFGLSSPLIASFFRKVPFLRLILVVGFIFLSGLTITHGVLISLTNAGHIPHWAIVATGVSGILLTRGAMSWLFHKYPVQTFALR